MREVLPKLDVELVELRETVCCGDAVRSVKSLMADYLAARVLALVKLTGLKNLLVPCNRCHFAISETRMKMAKNRETSRKVTDLLAEEGLECDLDFRVWHTLDFLHKVVGLDRIKGAVVKPLSVLKLASHYGCQILRYSDLGRVDDAESPRKLDELICALGAQSLDYEEKLDCCGSALMYGHADSAISLAGTKLKALRALNVDGLVLSCPDCASMFDSRQKEAQSAIGTTLSLPVLYYTQLLGLGLKLKPEQLGLHLNQSPIDELLAKIPS